MKNGLMIIQGNGQDTMKEVTDSVKAVEERGMKMAYVDFMKRLSVKPHYERLHQTRTKRIQEEMMKYKMEWMWEKKGEGSHTDIDGALDKVGLFAAMTYNLMKIKPDGWDITCEWMEIVIMSTLDITNGYEWAITEGWMKNGCLIVIDWGVNKHEDLHKKLDEWKYGVIGLTETPRRQYILKGVCDDRKGQEKQDTLEAGVTFLYQKNENLKGENLNVGNGASSKDVLAENEMQE